MKNFPIKGWKWPFYIFGWINLTITISSLIIFGLNWLFLYISYQHNNKELSFIKNNPNFHKRVFYLGCVWVILYVIIFSALLIFLE